MTDMHEMTQEEFLELYKDRLLEERLIATTTFVMTAFTQMNWMQRSKAKVLLMSSKYREVCEYVAGHYALTPVTSDSLPENDVWVTSEAGALKLIEQGGSRGQGVREVPVDKRE